MQNKVIELDLSVSDFTSRNADVPSRFRDVSLKSRSQIVLTPQQQWRMGYFEAIDVLISEVRVSPKFSDLN